MSRNVGKGDSIGDIVPDGYFTVSQAAKLVDRSPDTLRRWREKNVYVPDRYMWAGRVKVYLYSESDIIKLIKIANDMKPGRKSKLPDSEGA